MYLILIIMGILFLAYFLCIAFFVGHGTNFYFIWLFLGVLTIGFAYLWKKGFFTAHIPILLRRLFLVVFCLGIIIFLVVEGCIFSSFHAKGLPGADYVIVLGAQMKKNGPSRALQYRLDAAIAYADENPDAVIIVSGGQGPDEHISEAQGMYDYLIEQGISPERIIKEDKSKNTVQNLVFSAEYLEEDKENVVIVSNNFHVFRAVKIAKKAGYENVSGLAARGEPFLQFNNMMREFFGVMKDFLFGNM